MDKSSSARCLLYSDVVQEEQEEDEEEAVKRAIKESFHEYFTTLCYLFFSQLL